MPLAIVVDYDYNANQSDMDFAIATLVHDPKEQRGEVVHLLEFGEEDVVDQNAVKALEYLMKCCCEEGIPSVMDEIVNTAFKLGRWFEKNIVESETEEEGG